MGLTSGLLQGGGNTIANAFSNTPDKKKNPDGSVNVSEGGKIEEPTQNKLQHLKKRKRKRKLS